MEKLGHGAAGAADAELVQPVADKFVSRLTERDEEAE